MRKEAFWWSVMPDSGSVAKEISDKGHHIHESAVLLSQSELAGPVFSGTKALEK